MTYLSDLDVMPCGPHRGCLLRHVPADHLLSLLDTDKLEPYPELEGYIRRAIRQLKAEVREQNGQQ